jgi:hypothetical protein
MNDDKTNTKPGADTAQPSRTPSAKAVQPPPAAPVVVLARATKPGVTLAGARVAKGATVRCTKAVAEFHEGRGEAVIVGSA